MHIIVCIKSVILHAPSGWIESGGGIPRTPEAIEFNPFDRSALEAGLRLREECGGRVTALSMGPQCAAFSLNEAKAMGAGRAVLVCDPALSGSDTLATSTALGAAIKKLAPFDLVVFGTRTADSDTGQVGPQTAVELGLPLVTRACSMERMKDGLRVSRRADGFQEQFEVTLPAALTIDPASSPPRDIPLSGIEDAFGKDEIENWSLSDIGLSPDQVGKEGSGTRVPSMKRVDRQKKCEFISGSEDEQAGELVRRLVERGLIG